MHALIYQIVVLTTINRLTLKRFEEKYLLLSGFTLQVVQISPANILYSIHVWMKRCTIEHLTFTRLCGSRIQVRWKILILPYSVVYLRIQKWKNYWNRSTFAKVIVKIKVSRFYGPRCRLCTYHEMNWCSAYVRTDKPQLNNSRRDL